MKNKEKYFSEISKAFFGDTSGCCDFKIKKIIKAKSCCGVTCEECDKKVKEWFEQEAKESVILTEDEKAILRNVDKRYKYIARTINTLEIFETKPRKDDVFGWVRDKGVKDTLRIFGHLFAFIKSTDKEPYSIEDLLNDR